MRLPALFQFRVLKEAVTALISGPFTTKFPFEEHVPAERFRGKPEYQDEHCVGCGACAAVCPAEAIDVKDSIENRTRELTYHSDHCIFCGQCQAHCITEKGIVLTHEFDLACFSLEDCAESITKELVVCQDCGEVVGTREHIEWVAKKLGPLAFSNPTLFLSSLKNIDIVDEVQTPERDEISRADRLNILCPRCRRAVVLTEAGV